jgi:hypothetical protein
MTTLSVYPQPDDDPTPDWDAPVDYVLTDKALAALDALPEL